MTESGEGNAPHVALRGRNTPSIVFCFIEYHNALSGAGSDGLCVSSLRSFVSTKFGMEHFGKNIGAYWRRSVDEPGAFPSEIWEATL